MERKFQFEEYVNSWRLKLAMLYDIRYCYTSIKSVDEIYENWHSTTTDGTTVIRTRAR